jgi:hypothetical protein
MTAVKASSRDWPISEARCIMAKKKTGSLTCAGRWRITWMDQWDQDYVDEEVEGYFEFQPNGLGEFQFGYVQGNIDHRTGLRDGKPAVEFTWDGMDGADGTLLTGRGWAVLEGNELDGAIFIHLGDDSEFKARKAGRPQSKKGK